MADGGATKKEPRPIPIRPNMLERLVADQESEAKTRGYEGVQKPIDIKRATGGPINAPAGKAGMGPKFGGGGRGGTARLQKAAMAKR